MTLDAILNAYIDANFLLIAGTLIWIGARRMLDATRLRAAPTLQLHLLYLTLAVLAVLPFALLLAEPLLAVSPVPLKLSDLLVSHYLDGGIALAPSTFEQLLLLRTEWVHQIVNLSTPLGWGLAAALVVGIGAGAVRAVYNVAKVQFLLRDSYAMRTFGRVELRLTDRTEIPFSTRGVWRSYIVLPTSLLSSEKASDLRVAVAHEAQHVRQGDLVWEQVLELLRPLFVFNPAFAYCKREVERLRELSCDAQVLDRQLVSPLQYSDCLLRVCQNALRAQNRATPRMPAVALVTCLNGRRQAASERFLNQRVRGLFQPSTDTRLRMWQRGLLGAVLVLAVSGMAVGLQRSGDWSQDRLMLSTIVNLERLNQRNAVGFQ